MGLYGIEGELSVTNNLIDALVEKQLEQEQAIGNGYPPKCHFCGRFMKRSDGTLDEEDLYQCEFCELL